MLGALLFSLASYVPPPTIGAPSGPRRLPHVMLSEARVAATDATLATGEWRCPLLPLPMDPMLPGESVRLWLAQADSFYLSAAYETGCSFGTCFGQLLPGYGYATMEETTRATHSALATHHAP